MSTGGIFQLITNDGKQDRMLLATQLLNQRLLEIERARASDPKIRDPTPTLADIERTHIVFVNAHFKPFAAIGYEYNKTNPQSGNARLGGSDVQFSIPQFGDFFNDMALHLRLSAVTATNAAYWTNTANVTPVGAELIRYCNYPGQRVCKNVRFEVNGNPLDKYDSNVMNMHQKFFVTPNKAAGWARNTGQELPRTGFADVASVGAPNVTYTGRGSGVRQQLSFVDGPQTPKPTQPALDMYIPLLFWFNEDPRLSIPSVSIPYGQRFVYFEFCSAAELLQQVGAYPELDDPSANVVPTPDIEVCELYINNIFVNPEIHDIYIKRIGFNLIRTHLVQTFIATKSEDNFQINQLKWPVETMYIGLRPNENKSTTSTKMLTSWDQYAQTTEVSVNDTALRNGFRVPTAPADFTAANLNAAASFVAASGVAGAFTGTPASWSQLNAQIVAQGFAPLPVLPTTAFTTANYQTFANAVGVNTRSSYLRTTPTITSLRVQAQGIDLYRDFPAQFFNSYIPYNYSGTAINTPVDVGVLMVTFNLYPRTYQPSGYLNVSRAREFYVRYTSDLVGSTISQAEFVIVACAINFLLVSDGSAVLRYAT
jgi:hypothetical protein